MMVLRNNIRVSQLRGYMRRLKVRFSEKITPCKLSTVHFAGISRDIIGNMLSKRRTLKLAICSKEQKRQQSDFEKVSLHQKCFQVKKLMISDLVTKSWEMLSVSQLFSYSPLYASTNCSRILIMTLRSTLLHLQYSMTSRKN